MAHAAGLRSDNSRAPGVTAGRYERCLSVRLDVRNRRIRLRNKGLLSQKERGMTGPRQANIGNRLLRLVALEDFAQLAPNLEFRVPDLLEFPDAVIEPFSARKREGKSRRCRRRPTL